MKRAGIRFLGLGFGSMQRVLKIRVFVSAPQVLSDSCFNIFDIGPVLFTWVMDFSIIFCRGIIIAIYLCSRGLSHSSEVCESWLGLLLVLPHSQWRQQYPWHPFLSGLKKRQPAVSHKALAGHMMCYYCINCILACEKAIPVSPARQLLCFDRTKWSLS